MFFGGPDGARTHDLLDAIEARYQLRHRPSLIIVRVSLFPAFFNEYIETISVFRLHPHLLSALLALMEDTPPPRFLFNILRTHHPPAFRLPISGKYVDVFAPKTCGAMVCITVPLHFRAAVRAREIFLIALEFFLRIHFSVRPGRIELPAFSMSTKRSTTELRARLFCVVLVFFFFP